MKLVIQKVQQASVSVDGLLVNEIDQGLLVLVGVSDEDDAQDVAYAAKKISQMRIFSDPNGKMNDSVQDVQGSILLISQFTLFAQTKKGNRPSFVKAGAPQHAKMLYDSLTSELRGLGVLTKQGVFGTDMQVALVNDGPVTIIMDTKEST